MNDSAEPQICVLEFFFYRPFQTANRRSTYVHPMII